MTKPGSCQTRSNTCLSDRTLARTLKTRRMQQHDGGFFSHGRKSKLQGENMQTPKLQRAFTVLDTALTEMEQKWGQEFKELPLDRRVRTAIQVLLTQRGEEIRDEREKNR